MLTHQNRFSVYRVQSSQEHRQYKVTGQAVENEREVIVFLQLKIVLLNNCRDGTACYSCGPLVSGFVSFSIKIWGKSVQEFQSFDRTYKQKDQQRLQLYILDRCNLRKWNFIGIYSTSVNIGSVIIWNVIEPTFPPLMRPLPYYLSIAPAPSTLIYRKNEKWDIFFILLKKNRTFLD